MIWVKIMPSLLFGHVSDIPPLSASSPSKNGTESERKKYEILDILSLRDETFIERTLARIDLASRNFPLLDLILEK